MGNQIILAPEAEQDLDEIVAYIAKDNPAAAEKYGIHLIERIGLLKSFPRLVSRVLERLRKIINNHVGVIELAEDLDIETVTEIFIRVNSAGTELSQRNQHRDRRQTAREVLRRVGRAVRGRQEEVRRHHESCRLGDQSGDALSAGVASRWQDSGVRRLPRRPPKANGAQD